MNPLKDPTFWMAISLFVLLSGLAVYQLYKIRKLANFRNTLKTGDVCRATNPKGYTVRAYVLSKFSDTKVFVLAEFGGQAFSCGITSIFRP